jgi:FAD/FMN-containing dehydrogenase
MADLLAELSQLLGPNSVQTDVDPRHLGDWMLACRPEEGPRAVVYPRSTAEVSAVAKLCSRDRVPLVAQGGLTGLVGGATPVKGCVVVSLERMRRIEEVDVDAATMTVEAGVPLQAVQEAAEDAGMFFPLDLGARGSCLIGGNLSTNAGGNRVVRFGMARELVLGVEAVLADGSVVSVLNKMLKNNAGYDIKQLFLGSEGTLGIITRAVLRLYPKPAAVCTTLCGLADFDHVVRLLRLVRREMAGAMSAFELMSPEFFAIGCAEAGGAAPLAGRHGSYVLIESMGQHAEEEQARAERAIGRALDEGIVADAVVAQSAEQAKALWAIRDASGSFKRTFFPHVNFDVSVPIGSMGAFMAACRTGLAARWPGVECLWFGHVADSNLHLIVRAPADPHPVEAIDEIVYAVVRDWRGSVSAEHGIGVLKRPFLPYSATPEALALMKRLKAALDPDNLLNPGKVLP